MIHLLLLLPALASSSIIVTIETSDPSSVTTKGTESHIISDRERTTFGLADEVLRVAAEKYSGGKPQDVFLHSPTPWNDLYKTYGWREVRRILRPVKSQILDVQKDKKLITLRTFDNNSTSTVKFDGSIMEEVENSVENKWNKAGVLDVKEPIQYNINGPVVFSYSSQWGSDAADSKKMLIGSNADVAVTLEPGQVVTAMLLATKMTVTAQIDYAATLSGHVACNYPRKYKEHHFWRYEINGLMAACKLIRTVNSSEVIRVQFYTDAKIVVTDKKTNAKLSEVPAVLNSI